MVSLKVGFFKSARYPDGTQVAAVAAWNEFGTKRIPERPFMRQGVKKAYAHMHGILVAEVDPLHMTLDDRLADKVGAYIAGQIQKRIVDLRIPANAPLTVKMKGSSNPLVDTGKMRQSVTWKVEKGEVV